MPTVTLELPEEVLTAAKIERDRAPEEVRLIIALERYRENAVSVGKAAQIAGVCVADFMELSAQADMPQHYTLEDLRADRETIRRIGL